MASNFNSEIISERIKRNIPDRYEMGDIVHSRRYWQFYKAYDKKLRRDVVIKILTVDDIPKSEDVLIRQFEREIQTLKRLKHPNIVEVLDVIKTPDTLAYVIPYYPGESLKKRIKKPMAYREAVSVLIPIADALDYCHNNGVIHRNIKPDVIIFTEKNIPILIGFTILIDLEEKEPNIFGITNPLVGTPGYRAPEQFKDIVTKQSDLYSLGVVFYEMITGDNPFRKPGSLLDEEKILGGIDLKPRQFIPDLPRIVERTIIQATRKNPNERFQNMGEFKAALEKIYSIKKESPNINKAQAHEEDFYGKQ